MKIATGSLLLCLVLMPALLGSQRSNASTFAALSYSESSGSYAVGLSDIGFNPAYDDARAGCGHSDCFIRAAIKDGCLAMARDTSWDSTGFSGQPLLSDAEAEALLFCQRPWQQNCHVEFSFCSQTFKE